MKIIGISGTPHGRENSVTRFALEQALGVIDQTEIETLHIDLSDYSFSGCHDCRGCSKTLRCSQDDDFTNKLLPILQDTDIAGFIFASPVYFGGVSGLMKMFFDRTLPLRRHSFAFENVVAGAITVGGARNGGQELAAMDIAKFALIHGMIVVPDAPPTSHFGGAVWGRQPEEITEKSSDIIQAQNLAKKIAEIAIKLS